MKHIITILLLLTITELHCQSNQGTKRDTSDITFSGTKINPYQIEFDSSGHFSFSGYIDTYYAYYTDSLGPHDITRFPTIAPRNNQVGLNMAQASARYISNNLRGTITVFAGDCPITSWSPQLNFIQEANAGFRILPRLWFDAGFFRTHIGLESIQPRENVTMSIATTTYFEPYFMSGAKLTWQVNDKLALQLHTFNSFNTFIETNKNKAIGLSAAYTPSSKHAFAFSSITCDESPDSLRYDQFRWYNNLLYTFKTVRWVIGLEANYGLQQHSKLQDSTATATMYSALAAIKYRFTPKWALYGRGEIFSDPDEILTGPVENSLHELVGLDIVGGTLGFEYKPIPNSYFRVEGRYLHTKGYEDIFFYDHHHRNFRYEIITGLGTLF